MNSQEYRNLQEAYLQVYSASTLNEFGPGDVGGSFQVGKTFGGAPGTQQKITVSGSASSGGSNVSGSLTKGTFSGQGDETSRGVDNAIRNYETGSNGNTSTSTSTTGVRGTLDANFSGKFGSGNTAQDARERDAKQAAVMTNVAKNLASQNQQKAKAAAAERLAAASSTRVSRPDDGETPNEKKPEDTTTARSRLELAGITPGDATSRNYLQNKIQGPNSAKVQSLENDLNAVEGEDNKARIAQSVNPRSMERIPGTDRYRVGSLITQSFDLFDYMMEYLIDEGYANTNESALVIMANMSEDWRESIVEKFSMAADSSKPELPK